MVEAAKSFWNWFTKHLEDAISSFSAKSFVAYASSLSCFMAGLHWIVLMEGDWKIKVGLGALLTIALFGFQALLTSRSIFSDLDLPAILAAYSSHKAPEPKERQEN